MIGMHLRRVCAGGAAAVSAFSCTLLGESHRVRAQCSGGSTSNSASIPAYESEPGLCHYLPDQKSEVVREIAAFCRYYSPQFAPKDVPAFYDLSGLTEKPRIFQQTIDIFVDRYRKQIADGCGPTVVVGYDARGFVLGPPVALALQVGCVVSVCSVSVHL